MTATGTPTLHDEIMRERRDDCTRLGLFHACPRARCRRSQACRGDVTACERTRGIQVPQAVHDYFEAEFELGRANENDPADDEERAEVEAKRAALTCWLAGLAAASGLRGRR